MPTSRVAERKLVGACILTDASCDKSYADDLISFGYCKLRSSLELRLAEVHPRSGGLFHAAGPARRWHLLVVRGASTRGRGSEGFLSFKPGGRRSTAEAL